MGKWLPTLSILPLPAKNLAWSEISLDSRKKVEKPFGGDTPPLDIGGLRFSLEFWGGEAQS